MFAAGSGQLFGINQQPLRCLQTVADVELAIVKAGFGLEIEITATPNLQTPYHRSRIVQSLDTSQQLIAPRNLRQNRAGVIVLRLRPRHNLGIFRVLQPAVRVTDRGAKVFFSNFSHGSIRQFRLAKRGGRADREQQKKSRAVHKRSPRFTRRMRGENGSNCTSSWDEFHAGGDSGPLTLLRASYLSVDSNMASGSIFRA